MISLCVPPDAQTGILRDRPECIRGRIGSLRSRTLPCRRRRRRHILLPAHCLCLWTVHCPGLRTVHCLCLLPAHCLCLRTDRRGCRRSYDRFLLRRRRFCRNASGAEIFPLRHIHGAFHPALLHLFLFVRTGFSYSLTFVSGSATNSFRCLSCDALPARIPDNSPRWRIVSSCSARVAATYNSFT